MCFRVRRGDGDFCGLVGRRIDHDSHINRVDHSGRNSRTRNDGVAEYDSTDIDDDGLTDDDHDGVC